MTALESFKDTLSQPDVIREAWSLAGRISTTEFVPKSLRGSTEKVMAALLAGRELGLGPMTALAHVHIVEGRPALSTEAKVALALAAGHALDVVETNTERCVIEARRAGSDRAVTVTYTMKDAASAGLTNKDNWKKYPRRMLQARCSSEAVRLVAPDTTLGIPLSVEEAEDMGSEAPKRAQVVRRNRPAEPDPPALDVPSPVRAIHAAPERPADVTDDGEVIDGEVIEDDALDFEPEPLMQDNQRKRIRATQTAAKVGDAELKAIVSAVTDGRTDSTALDAGLTKTEASQIIHKLDNIETARNRPTTADRTA